MKKEHYWRTEVDVVRLPKWVRPRGAFRGGTVPPTNIATRAKERHHETTPHSRPRPLPGLAAGPEHGTRGGAGGGAHRQLRRERQRDGRRRSGRDRPAPLAGQPGRP